VPGTQEALPRPSKIWSVLVWCSPSLLGFVAFLFSFPIDRSIPIWPHLNIAEIFTLWFLSIAPATTVIAIVVFVKHKTTNPISPSANLLVWAAIIISLLVNTLVLLGMWASTY
jgi:hypothetical protein